jgi:hypothetical protein
MKSERARGFAAIALAYWYWQIVFKFETAGRRIRESQPGRHPRRAQAVQASHDGGTPSRAVSPQDDGGARCMTKAMIGNDSATRTSSSSQVSIALFTLVER